MQILHSDESARCVNQAPNGEADRTGGETCLASLHFNFATAVNGSSDIVSLLAFDARLQLELILLPNEFELDGGQSFVVARLVRS